MGTCYSQKARGADPHTVSSPSEMPEFEPGVLTAGPCSSTRSNSSNLGQHQPQPQNGNEQPDNESCTALNTITENTPRMSQRTEPSLTTKTNAANAKTTRGGRSRFGFKIPRSASSRKPDTNSNLLTTSTDSVNSATSSHSGSGTKNRTTSEGAYEADGADKWLMIDDSRSNSRASSVKSKKSAASKERQLADAVEDISNGNREPVSVDRYSANSVSLDNKDKASLGGSGGRSGSRLSGPQRQSKARAPILRFGATRKDTGGAAGTADSNRWVKATVASECTAAAPHQKGSSRKLDFAPHKLEDSSRKADGKDKKAERIGKKHETNGKKVEANGKKSEQRSGGRGAVSFLRSLGKPRTQATSGQDQMDCPARVVDKDKMEKPAQPREVLQVKAPIAVIESAETTSIGSINSDDLMLDVDINLDGYDDDGQVFSQSAQSLTRSRNPSCSKSQDSMELARPSKLGKQEGTVLARPGGLVKPSENIAAASTTAAVARYERKPMLARRYPGDSSSLPRRHNSGGHSQKMTTSSRHSQSSEPPLQELATLMQDNPAVTRWVWS